jgi:hypothetical protein
MTQDEYAISGRRMNHGLESPVFFFICSTDEESIMISASTI